VKRKDSTKLQLEANSPLLLMANTFCIKIIVHLLEDNIRPFLVDDEIQVVLRRIDVSSSSHQ
jgi:hypothetical protein